MPEDDSDSPRRSAPIVCWRCRAVLSPQVPRCPRCHPDPPPIPEGEWVERYRDGAVDE
jgi:predicted amidophosphoribosyltransferase